MGQSIAFLSAAVLALWVGAVGVDGLPGPWPVLGATLGMGLGNALVPPEDLDEAVALNSVSYNLARAVGPAAGGLAHQRLDDVAE